MLPLEISQALLASRGSIPDWPGVPLNLPRTGWGKLVAISPGEEPPDGKWMLTEYVYDEVGADWNEAKHPEGYENYKYIYEISGSGDSSEDDLVQFWEGSLASGAPCLFYQRGGGGEIKWAKATQDWVKVAGNGSYVPCNAVDNKAGDNEDTEDSFNVYLPRCGSVMDPNVIDDSVIPYIIDSAGDAICVGEYLDGTIDKSVEIWRGLAANLAAEKPGWRVCDDWDDTPFLAAYDPDVTDYNCTSNTGGYWWHGQTLEGGTANNHTDHCLGHCHSPATLPCLPCHWTAGEVGSNGWTGDADWTEATTYNEHDGPFNDGVDTDNRPPYKVTLFVERYDNSAAAP